MAYFFPLTAEIPVNSTQRGEQEDARTVGLSDGGFVVVWTTSDSAYGPDFVMMQRYDSTGAMIGENIQVNAETGPGQIHKEPQVELLDDGSWVVVWQHFDVYASPQSDSILAQVFNADGTRKGDEFTVVLDTLDKPADPSVTAVSDGAFLVTWEVIGGPIGWGTEIRAQKADADGPIGPQIEFETASLSSKNNAIVTTLSDGNLALVWMEAVETGFLYGVTESKAVAQIITEDGQAIGDEFELFADNGQRFATDVAALPSGEFLVVGNGSPLGGRSSSIVVQKFSNDGEPIGDFLIKPDVGAGIYNAQLAALPDGGYAVTYSVLLDDTTSVPEEQTDTFLIRFNAFGRQFADPYQVNVQSASGLSSNFSDIAVLADGNVVVAWQGREQLAFSNFDTDVYARIYNADMYGTGLWDVLTGTNFDDRIFGLGFNDHLYGEAGNDHLIGGRSDDLLDGGLGDDLLDGGGGWDEFRFSSGNDRIIRFDDNRDRIVLDGAALGVTGYSATEIIETFGTMNGNMAIFDFGDGNILTVNRVASLDVFVDDFIIG